MPIKTKEGKNEIHNRNTDRPFADQYYTKKEIKEEKPAVKRNEVKDPAAFQLR